MNDLSKSAQPPSQWRRLRNFLVGTGLILIGFLVWVWLLRTPVPPTSEPKKGPLQQIQPRPEPTTAAGPRTGLQAPAAPAAALQSQIEQVLSGIREANQKKDLSQLLSYYSPNFPQLPQRAQSISKDWKVYDYPKMDFEIKELRLLADNTAVAKVTWNVEVRNLSTKKTKNVSKTYLTRFVKESGQWRIQALDKRD